MGTAKAVDITRMDADPSKMVEAGSHTGKVRVSRDTIAALTTDIDDDDILIMCQVPSNAKVMSIKLFNDDLDSNGAPALVTDVGLYNGPDKFTDTDASLTQYLADGLIDRDCYGTLLTTLQAANTAGVELRYETLDINSVANYAWEDGGLTSDPGVNLRIALTIETVAATAAAGDITMEVQYVVN